MGAIRRGVRKVWEWTRPVLVAVVLLIGVRTFLVDAFQIPTSSMENTLLVGDFLLVNKFVYGAEIPGLGMRIPALREPERGDVVVFFPPHEPGQHFVKRVVGVPGDTLQMRGKQLLVNGSLAVERYARHLDPHGDAVHGAMEWQADHRLEGRRRGRRHPTRDNWGPLVVPPDRFFVLGDNRDNSEDSRYWGFVGRESIVGKPWVVWYSVSVLGSEPAETRPTWIGEVRWDRIGDVVR